MLKFVQMASHLDIVSFHRAPCPLPRGNPLPLETLPPPLPVLVGMPPLADGMLDLLVLVAAVPGVVGGPPPKADFLLGVAFMLAKLVSPVPTVVSSPRPPVMIVDTSVPSFCRCCFCHRLIESVRGACGGGC